MFDIRSFGAQGDGIADDSGAIYAAITMCKKQGGGTVYVPAGVYRSGPITFVSHMTLHLEAGAVIRFIPEFSLYGRPVRTRWEGVECYGFQPLVFGTKLEQVAITGRGTLDGEGQAWWDEVRRRREEKRLWPETEIELELARLNQGYETEQAGGGGRAMQFLRPPLVQFFDCHAVLIEGITLRNSPFWTVHPVYCDELTVRSVTFINPPAAPNTDGLDVDSCTNVHITGCTFDVGDDCICLKSGSGPDGRRVNRPTENVMISDCFMHKGHGAVVIGSETAGGIRNVTVTNCVFSGTERGIRLKTRRGRGGEVSTLVFSSLLMEDVLCPLVINMFYRCGAREDEEELFSRESRPVSDATPYIHDISFFQITVRRARVAAGFFVGLPERPLEDITLGNCSITMEPDEAIPADEAAMSRGLAPARGRGLRLAHVHGGTFRQVQVRLAGGEPLLIEEDVELDLQDC